ncbi:MULTISPECIES: hypothetical protein [Sorangium]|uniref:hypothetical protein n=1 Tax=Sorangium TaxID=39643 RepID=UPI003D9C0B0F
MNCTHGNSWFTALASSTRIDEAEIMVRPSGTDTCESNLNGEHTIARCPWAARPPAGATVALL